MKKPNLDKAAIFNRGTLMDFLAIILGSALWVFAVDAIVIPNDLLSGGLTGIAIMINYALPVVPVSIMAVSYTHLDVYKRQAIRGLGPSAGCIFCRLLLK